MKKVLLITENFPPIEGGSGRWFWELYSRLPKNKVLVCTHNIEGGNEFDSTHDIPTIRMPLHSKEWGIKSLKGLIFYWQTIKRLKCLIRAHNIEEVHCGRVIHEGVSGRVLKLLTGVPFRCFVHGEDVETAATSREHSFMVKQVCKHASSLICNSYNTQKLVSSLGFSTQSKCDVLHPGVDINWFKPSQPKPEVRQKYGWSSDALILLTVGRLQKRKGQDFLVEAMPSLLKHIPHLQYVIVGRGEELENLRLLIEKHQLQKSVFIHIGFDDADLVNAYQQCDVFILPNRTIRNDIEGFGMVLVEAQACGKPVIAGDSGGTVETLQENVTGFVINCSSPKIIEAELPKLLVKASTLDNTYIAANVRNKFNWCKHTRAFIKLMDISK